MRLLELYKVSHRPHLLLRARPPSVLPASCERPTSVLRAQFSLSILLSLVTMSRVRRRTNDDPRRREIANRYAIIVPGPVTPLSSDPRRNNDKSADGPS